MLNLCSYSFIFFFIFYLTVWDMNDTVNNFSQFRVPPGVAKLEGFQSFNAVGHLGELLRKAMTRWRYSWSVLKLDWATYTSSTEENGPTNNVISSAAVWGRSWDLGPGNIFMTSPCTCSSLQHLPSHAALHSPLHTVFHIIITSQSDHANSNTRCERQNHQRKHAAISSSTDSSSEITRHFVFFFLGEDIYVAYILFHIT